MSPLTRPAAFPAIIEFVLPDRLLESMRPYLELMRVHKACLLHHLHNTLPDTKHQPTGTKLMFWPFGSLPLVREAIPYLRNSMGCNNGCLSHKR